MAGKAAELRGQVRVSDYLSVRLLSCLVPPSLVDEALTAHNRHSPNIAQYPRYISCNAATNSRTGSLWPHRLQQNSRPCVLCKGRRVMADAQLPLHKKLSTFTRQLKVLIAFCSH
jgi:hypothetical protein